MPSFNPISARPIGALPRGAGTFPLLVLDGLKVLVKVAGKSYYAESRGLVRLISASIDMTVADQTPLFLVPAGVSVVITDASFNCTAAANVAAPATAQIAIVGAISGAIYPSQELVGLLVAGDLFRFPVGGSGVTAGPGDSITLNIDAPATGASVSQTAQIELVGYLV